MHENIGCMGWDIQVFFTHTSFARISEDSQLFRNRLCFIVLNVHVCVCVGGSGGLQSLSAQNNFHVNFLRATVSFSDCRHKSWGYRGERRLL